MKRPSVHRVGRPGLPAALLLGLALLLPGCGLLPGADAEPARPAPTTADGDAGLEPAQPAFDIRVESADAKLRTLVQRHNELRRYRALHDLDDAEFARLMALAERDVRNLLGTEGYFLPEVRIRRERGDPRPVVVIEIDPGTPTTVRRVQIEFEGDIATTTDAAALRQRTAIEHDWALDKGRRFTQERWSDAKTEALRQLVQQRYPRGRIRYSLADVDAAAARVDLTLRLDSGAPYHLGPSVVQGAQRYPAWLPGILSWLEPGEVYDQKRLVDAQQRLTGSGYYDSAYISIEPDGGPDAVPVLYTLTEARRQKLQLGIGYSTDAGPRLTLEHRHNRFLGSSWRADTRLQLDRKTPLLQAELSSLPNAGGWRWTGMGRYMRQDDGTLNTLSRTLRVGRIKNAERYDRQFYLQYEHATVTGSGSTAVPDALLGDGAALSANYAWTGRYFDSLLTPRRGWGLGFDVGAGMTTLSPRKPFARMSGRWLGFVSLGQGDSRLALRAEGAAILASDAARLPATMMFRTGGDATVRGYAYRRIGIPVGGGLVGPGRYMGVGSVEWQRPILQERFPGLLEHTLFIDVGSVANHARNLRPHWGVGTGLRLLTPVGPMQLDLAYGLKTREVRLHMNVGFVF
ncbi:MAG TPA: BamA/TamA family outer membrane protein [Ottowia sp.]|uniref:autotransporter assembly complex protein TamA n=1 Tax=Ottowia sp. TaxID=1898956 RepID=UPI002B6B7F1C|nr:BamA/TamA family outer membrane protein [Ottowia sp.]HMN20256.1 BamA/TamA family outer membrane protein [Ottowia sp.]